MSSSIDSIFSEKSEEQQHPIIVRKVTKKKTLVKKDCIYRFNTLNINFASSEPISPEVKDYYFNPKAIEVLDNSKFAKQNSNSDDGEPIISPSADTI
mmetsp:Transcript_23274/g.20164  ORF Transcript_23274/g.20164 Transcript_23274/m.20164 type:complete len:97 (+) Transcript_23274:100-390(+)